MSNTSTRTPEPQEPDTMPEGWPPKPGVVGDHVRRWLAWYVLTASLLTLAGIAWTIWALRQQSDDLALMKQMIYTKER